ncbi:MAG: DUF1674 domain-containing protein [Proteobacteria bacterium]|nr:DUF1674 domain-containing protein [Pseudomonadota bacterium]
MTNTKSHPRTTPNATTPPSPKSGAVSTPLPVVPAAKVPEMGGPTGPEPTRYGDWERNGRCIDF